jgi:hypothetical protein
MVNCIKQGYETGRVKYTKLRPTYIFKYIPKFYAKVMRIMHHFNSNAILVNEESGFRKDTLTPIHRNL